MAIDPSIPLGVKTAAQTNPLASLKDAASISNSLAYNRLIDQNIQRGQVDMQTAQQNQSYTGWLRTAQQATSLLMVPPGQLTADMVNSTIQDGVKSGFIQPQVAQVWQQQTNQIGNNDAALRQALRQHITSALNPDQQIAALGGQNQDMSNGQVLQPGVRQSAWMGGGWSPSSPGIPQFLTPAQKATQIPTVDNTTGQQGTVPLSSRVDDQGNARGSAMGNGTYGGGAQPGAQPGFNATGLPPGTDQNLNAYYSAKADIPNAVNRIADMKKVVDLLHLVNTGPGTGTWQQIRSGIQSLPVINGLAKPELGNEDSVAAYDSARKYMQAVTNKMQVGNTAQGLLASQHSNANPDISQGANFDVMRTNIGAERMAIAQTQSSNKMSYLDDAGKFASANDRRAFSADLYTPQQLKQLEGSLRGDLNDPKSEKARFFRSLGVATRMGLLNLPTQQAPQVPQQQPAAQPAYIPQVPTQ